MLKLLYVLWHEEESLPAKSQPWSHGRYVSEISKSLEDCVGGRPVGSRESENIIPPSVNFHSSLKNASKNDEHSLGESGLSQAPSTTASSTWSSQGQGQAPADEMPYHPTESWKVCHQPLLNPLHPISALRPRNSHFQALLYTS